MKDPWRRIAPLAVAALAVAVLQPAYADNAVVGPLTSGDPLFPHQGNGGYDVSHYDLDLVWNPGPSGGTIDATATISATTTGAPLDSFGLDLEGLTVDSVKVDGASSPFARVDIPDPLLSPGHKLVVTPATPVSGAFTVEVGYHGTPVTHVDADGSPEGWIPTPDGATFLNQPIGSMAGFPNNDTPRDKATYTIAVDVPDDREVASNGELTSSTSSGGRRTWLWTETRPMASELAMISIGQYDVHESDITMPSGTVHEWSFVDSSLDASTKSSVEAQRVQLGQVLTSLESRFGPYPGGSTGIVVDALNTGYALETQDRPFFPGGLIHETLVHELTHQWYGDAVSPTVWNDLWINEGMATWAPVDVSGASTYDKFHGKWASTPAGSPLWTTPPAGITDPGDLFGWQSYDRGAMTYEALRTLVGDPAFRTLIKQWQQTYHGGSHGAADLQAMAEQISGLSLTAFFQDWIRDPDKPAWPAPATPPTQPPPTQPPPPATIGAECHVKVKGAARVGHTLRAKVPGCPAGATFSYRWLTGVTRISGATRAAYKIPPGKVGKRIKVRVTVRAPGYLDAVRVSKATAKVR